MSTYRRVYPASSSSSQVAVHFRHRAVKGVGAYASAPGLPSLTLQYTLGSTEQVPVDDILLGIESHCRNNGFEALVTPTGGQTPIGVLHEALIAATPSTGTAWTIFVFIDGPETVSIG